MGTEEVPAAADSLFLCASRRFLPLALFAFVRQRLSNRPDSEHEMTVNRLVLNCIVFVYLFFASGSGLADAAHVFNLTSLLFVGYNMFSVGLFAHILYDPGISHMRRVLAIFLDLGMISYVAYVGGGVTAFLYPLFLWTIFGNGFRFGIRYLVLSMLVSLVTFGIVISTVPFWRLHGTMGTGLWAGLALLPAYVGVLIRKLSEAKRQAEEASRAKTLFLASVSHELRTPLTSIIGLSDLLQDTSLDREQMEMANTVSASGRALSRLINTLLDFSRAEAGKGVVEQTRIDLYSLLCETREMLAVLARAKGLHLALHVNGRVPRFVMASQRHLQEALLNLASNAVKFTEKGYVLIAVDLVQLQAERAVLGFDVSDTGIGIAKEAQSRIFETFTQADSTIIDRFGGTGLGLAIVKQLVEAQNGKISVSSALGQGSTFRFEVEVRAVPAPNPLETAQTQTGETPRGAVLFSSDTTLSGMLEDAGIKIALASDFAGIEQARREFAAQGVRRPAVIVDEAMAGQRMEILAREISESQTGGRSAVVGIAAGSSVPLVSPAGRRFFCAIVPRPLSAPALSDILGMAHGSQRMRKPDGVSGSAQTVVQPRRLLLAEDNGTNQKVIAKILEKSGHEVVVVSDGEAALDALRDSAFHLVLMDVNMPVMNGVEAAKLYRFTNVDQPQVPIVALTADVSDASQQRCREAGMAACLMKPIDAARLAQMVELHASAQAIGPAEGQGASLAAPAASRDVSPPIPDSDRPFMQASTKAIDASVLDELEALGGPEFVDEVVTQFTQDAGSVLHGLVQAIAGADAVTFRDSAHALRSCAANVGAQAIYSTCLAWRDVETEDIQRNGAAYLARLESELAEARAALARYKRQRDELGERRSSDLAQRRAGLAIN